MSGRVLDYNQSGEVVHADRKIVFGRQGLGRTDDRRVIPSSVLVGHVDVFTQLGPQPDIRPSPTAA